VSGAPIPPLNAPPAGQVSTGVQPGVTSAVLLANKVIVFGANGGIFVYNGTPALGNPPILAITTATTDPYGNDIKPGDADAAGALIALGPAPAGGTPSFIELVAGAVLELALGTGDADEVLSSALFTLISGSGAARTLVTRLASPSFLPTAGFSELQLASGSQDGVTSLPYAVLGSVGISTSAQLFAGLSGATGSMFEWFDVSGTWGFDRNMTDVGTHENNNAGGATAITETYTIPANTANSGIIYAIDVPLQIVMEGETLQLGLSLNGATAFTAWDTIGGAIVAAGIGLNGRLTVFAEITGNGTAGTLNAWVTGCVRQVGANVLFNNSAALAGVVQVNVSINTEVANTVCVNSLWGGSAAGQSVIGYGSKFTRSGT
jgi:hypothetical protein